MTRRTSFLSVKHFVLSVLNHSLHACVKTLNTTKDGESFTTNVLCFITDRPFTTVQNGKKVVSNKVVNVSFSKKLAEETNSAITKEWFKQNYKSVNCTLADGKTDWLVICAQGEFNDELAECEW